MNSFEFQKLKKIPEIGDEMYEIMVKLYQSTEEYTPRSC